VVLLGTGGSRGDSRRGKKNLRVSTLLKRGGPLLNEIHFATGKILCGCYGHPKKQNGGEGDGVGEASGKKKSVLGSPLPKKKRKKGGNQN